MSAVSLWSSSLRNDIACATLIIKKVGECKQHAKAAGYQLALFSDDAPVEVGSQRVFTFDPNYYPANSFYEGPFSFPNHYYRAVGAMNGEEARCAGLIDALPGVKWWVRNLQRRPITRSGCRPRQTNSIPISSRS